MSDTAPDFISLYLQYTSQTECPTFFHRWTALTSLGAYLGRQIHFQHGHFTIYPTMYTMLIGSPGTKKSSAIKIGAKVVKLAGYKTFAAKKTRQEKFLLDLAEQSGQFQDDVPSGRPSAPSSPDSLDSILDQNIFGDDNSDPDEHYSSHAPAECFVAADEFNNFIGQGNLDFVSILGELWDYEGVYDYRLKSSKSVYIPNPTISILGGNTPTGFATAFPVETIGQGFFSRLLLIYGEPTGVKFTFPPPPDLELQAQLIAKLHHIKQAVHGEVAMSKEAETMLDKIYTTWEGVSDTRFEHYANRRLTHLLKLCLVVTASRCSMSIEVEDVILANTILTFTENLMPKALGEFGRARNSDVTHKVMSIIDSAKLPISFQDIWKQVVTDLDRRDHLVEILGNLQIADKIQTVGATGFLPKKMVKLEDKSAELDWSLLTENERGLM